MGMLDKAGLLAKDKLKIEKVDLGGGDFVFVRQMIAFEHNIYTGLITKEAPVLDKDGKDTGEIKVERDMANWPSKLVACTVCDDKGNLLLAPEDWQILSQSKLAAKLDKIASKAAELNKMGGTEQEKRVKNSGAGQGAGSSSASA